MPIVRKKRKSRRKPTPPEIRVGCPFCWEWVPAPETHFHVFSADGCEGGRCSCGAFFVVDRTGKSGGQARLDAQALACQGDLDRALALRPGDDFDVKTRKLTPETGSRRPVATGHSYLEPQAWFLKLKGS